MLFLLQVPNVVFPGIGILRRRKDVNVLQAVEICDRFGSKCCGFSITKKNDVQFKHSLAMPEKGNGQTFYIKKEFAYLYEKGRNWSICCLVCSVSFHTNDKSKKLLILVQGSQKDWIELKRKNNYSGRKLKSLVSDFASVSGLLDLCNKGMTSLFVLWDKPALMCPV